MNHDICIRGAGIVGRALALLLARQSLRVALIEQAATHPGPDVRAYALNAASRALLDELRCWPEGPTITPVHAMEVFGDSGGQLRFDAHQQRVNALHWMVDVPALEARLGEAVRFQHRIEVLPQAVAAPLTVVCEGRASQTRAQWGIAFDVSHYPQHAIAARLQCERPHQGVARQWFGFAEVPGQAGPQSEIVALLPLGGAGASEVALVWSVHPARAQALQALDAEAFAQALETSCTAALGHMRLTSERAVWPLQLARASRWIGRLPGSTEQSFVLAGDAAHAMHPLAGQGLNVGLADVAELAQVIRDKEYWRPLHDLKLLRRYERARQAEVRAMALVTDGLQRLFTPAGGAWPTLRNWGLSSFDRSGPLKHWLTQQAMGHASSLAPTTPTA